MTTTSVHSIDRVMERCHLKNERAADQNSRILDFSA